MHQIDPGLLRIFGRTTYERGRQYFERGNVLAFEYASSHQIVGSVAGTRKTPYSVTVDFGTGPGSTIVSLSGTCTCPVGYNCKHVAATLIAARDAASWAPGLAKEPFPRGVRNWLERSPATHRDAEDKGKEESLKTSREPPLLCVWDR